jgi:hypothetical protein
MVYKRRYLDSGETPPSLKDTFLELQRRGEQLLSEPNMEAISPWSLDLVCRGAPSLWRSHRERNVRLLLELAPRAGGGKALFTSWPAGHCPFNAVYVFENEVARDRARNRLIDAHVYTPVHWPLRDGGTASVDLSKRILTIPLDFRCGDAQIVTIAAILTALWPEGAGTHSCRLIS